MVRVFVKGVKRHCEQLRQERGRNVGSKAIQSLESVYFLDLILLMGTKEWLQIENLETMRLCCSSTSSMPCALLSCSSFLSPDFPPSSSPPSSSWSVCVYVPNTPRLIPQRLPAAADSGTLSRLASSFIFCSSSHAMATKASTSTFCPREATRQSRTHMYACSYTQYMYTQALP